MYSVFKALQGIESEVFVVDNNSVDGSAAMIKSRFPQVQFIQNTRNLGFSAANNQALRLAKGKYRLLLNPDTVVQEDTFTKCLHFMETHADAGGLGIRMLDGKGKFLPESKRGLPTPLVAFYKIFGLAKLFPGSKKFGQYHLTFLDKDQNQEVEVLSGAFMLMRKEALDKAGLLDETFFMYGEDIDLSYRLILAGFKNYYFAESSIIHYKGESTKKSSVNYVFVFYKAMAIFANKHFSQSNARLFNFLIHFAIYVRAGAAIIARFLKQLFFPAIDFILILTGLYFCKDIYEVHYKIYPNFYSKEILNFFFPLYTLIWMSFTYFSGGYDKPLNLGKLSRGVITGSAFILIVYSLLPEHYRFSRALILIGSFYTLVVYLITRIIYHFAGIQRFHIGSSKAAVRMAVIGSETEFLRVRDIVQKTNIETEFLGFLSTDPNASTLPEFVGHYTQIDEAIRVCKLTEIIFCARDVSSTEIIRQMMGLMPSGLEFKIAPPESLSIIGSSSIDTAGDLYVIDVNTIGKPENRRSKRLVDVLFSIFLLLFSWIIILFQNQKKKYFSNCFNVLFGAFSWVGYGKAERRDLPTLRPSVLSPLDLLPPNSSAERQNRAILNYARDYTAERDLVILLKCWRKLGA